MKKVLLLILSLVLLLAACAPQGQATDLPEEGGEEPTQEAGSSAEAQAAAIAALSQTLGLDAGEITVVSTEAVEWPNACLGIEQEGIACAEVLTPGYKIVLEANGNQVEYHTDETGSVIVPATVALEWERSGGIAGFCDRLTIYLSGEVQGSNCKNEEMVQQSLSDLLSSEEIAIMNEWISQYGTVEIDMSDPAGAADAMSVKMTLAGTGSEVTMDEASQQLMLQFVQDLYQDLMSQ